MAKVHMTVVKLKALRDLRASYLKRLNAIDAKLRKLCTHPKRFMVTQSWYTTDTLGSNGWTTYSDKCTMCGDHVGEDYGEDRTGNGPQARYKEEERD